MNQNYDRSIFRGFLLKGDLKAAITYISQFPEQKELYNKYVSLFQKENYLTYDVDEELNEILLIYQKYYRNVFFLSHNADAAISQMSDCFAELFQLDKDILTASAASDHVPFDDLEKEKIAQAFHNKGFHFLGGQTSGYYGPYIWKTEEVKQYTVELPDKIQDYSVKFLDNFISKSWLDYLSFGDTGTGGWSNGDGLIHCIRSSYDLESEAFRVSLLKHEAQHAADLTRYKNMSPEDLEYRAKLVELIYSRERNLIRLFAKEADSSKTGNGHALAANRIIKGFRIYLHLSDGEFENLPVEKVQPVARKLFEESTGEIVQKYR